jgi:hypothetical protein
LAVLFIPFGFLVPKNFWIIWLSNLLDFEHTWWRLLQKRVMHTKLDVYFCITIIGSIPLLEQTSQRKALQHICTVLIRILMYHLESLVKISFAQNSKSAKVNSTICILCLYIFQQWEPNAKHPVLANTWIPALTCTVRLDVHLQKLGIY